MWYQQIFVDTGRSTALWALIGFVVTFLITRWITRRIRASKSAPQPEADEKSGGIGFSDIHIGGVHVHHQVWGILLVLICGLLEFRFSPDSPWSELLAAMFGAGAALALDEFALWFHLDDVYWGEEGRKSIDAILIGGGLGVVLLLQASPVGATNDGDLATWLYLSVLAVHLTAAGFCFLKGKLATGLIGIVLPIVATIGAIRLAKPGSMWARRRYSNRKMERSHRRFDVDYHRRRDRIRDLLGGSPTPQANPEVPHEAGGPTRPGEPRSAAPKPDDRLRP